MMNTPTHPTRIILSGLAGAGKSSVGKALAKKLGYTFYSAGSYARKEAEQRGITIQELQIQLKDEPDFDRKLDNQLIEWGECTDGWVMDYRMGFALLPDATSIYLTVEDEEAARRIGAASRSEEFNGDETTAAMLASIRERNENMSIRLLGLYGHDFTDQSKYDFVIATDGKSIEALVDEITHINFQVL
jgi:cytidylate kinase